MIYELVESDTRLEQLLALHQQHRFVAIDTEFRRRDTFYPQVALCSCVGIKRPTWSTH
jgi:ribonuclease D